MKVTTLSFKTMCLWQLSLILLGIAEIAPSETLPRPSIALPMVRLQNPRHQILKHRYFHRKVMPEAPKPTAPRFITPPSPDILSMKRLEDKKRPTEVLAARTNESRSLDDVQLAENPATIQIPPETQANFLGEFTVKP